MKTEIKLADNTNGFIIKNMYPLYLHDLAGIHHTLPNFYGIFEEEPIKTLEEQYNAQQIWFEHPGILFPYVIYADDFPAGFCLVGSGKYVPKDVDFLVYETFILSPFRGSSVAYDAMLHIFSKHNGIWMLFTHSMDNNNRAKAFWHKTVKTYTNENYSTEEKIIDDMPKLVFLFEN